MDTESSTSRFRFGPEGARVAGVNVGALALTRARRRFGACRLVCRIHAWWKAATGRRGRTVILGFHQFEKVGTKTTMRAVDPSQP